MAGPTPAPSCPDTLKPQHKILAPTRDGITIFSFLQYSPSAAELEEGALPELPSILAAGHLIETVYLYTQARYCLVDWVQIHKWHQQREAICFSSREDGIESQTGQISHSYDEQLQS